ncbi:hypothetical protein ABI_15870 [Asticcacaulis biprosthecium C19]|uniref:SGNH hydrolase-type esterase domain-containing protein n=1 Tax=Asticcacaulis biprosthecium C19 TaxID=715226 RepID=F4QJG4_9CAUL|nr:SGNH/GDSL hydrolase family protein [Asticcacaulis biprosthecium]EGF93147.1 hypothetical protein ABI_15870 [Asticcacaulis biprosthecium C19]
MSKSKKRIRAVVLGGSNTVMGLNPDYRIGYLWETFKACKKRGWKLDVIDDLSVGGTTIFNGLFRLKSCSKLKKADVLIVEYALNDTSGHEKDRKLLQHWARAYEGVIRYALAQNPRLRIISVILESRTAPAERRLSMIHAAIHRLSDVYRTRVIDIGRTLVETVGPEQACSDLYYLDSHHLAAPAVEMTKKALTRELIKAVSKRRRKRDLPEPMDPFHFADATAAGLDHLPEGPRIHRGNRRFHADGLELAGKRLVFTLVEGKLLGLNYICELSTGPAFMRCGDLLFHVNVMKPGITAGNFDFLVAASGCDFLYPPDVNRPAETRTYSISPVADGEITKTVTPRSMSLHPVNPSPTLAIVGLLYTGRMVDARIEDVLEPLPERMAGS